MNFLYGEAGQDRTHFAFILGGK